MQQSFLRQHSVNMLSFSAVAFPHAHFLGTLHHGGDHDEDIVQQADDYQQRSYNRQQNHLRLYLRGGSMHVAEGLQEILEACSLRLDLFKLLVRFLHLPDGIGERTRIHAWGQLHITSIAVVSHPVVGALLAVGLHRKQDVVIQAAVFREVLKDALDGQLQTIHISICNLLADDAAYVMPGLTWHLVHHLLGKAPAHHHAAPLTQSLLRIACQNRPVEHLEEAGIGTDQGGLQLISILIQVSIPVENICRARTYLDARDFFHKAHGYGPAHLPIIVFVPLLRVPGTNCVHTIDVLVEAVITQLKEHLGNEHDAHSQPDAQGEDFDQNI